MGHPITGKPYVTNRYLSLTLDDKHTWDNCQRIIYHRAPTRKKLKATMRDLIFKLLRQYEHQNKDLLKELWAKDQVSRDTKLPKITL